jgi:chorismate mutase/prephenate dehydratase
MSGALASEAHVRVAYLGPAATYTHHAARSRFGTSVEYMACEEVSDVFDMVENGGARYGVVAIENAINGPVMPVLDRLVDTPLKVYAEIMFPISHCLLSKSTRKEIKQVHSHPQAIAQCQRWLRMELPGVELIPTTSTSKAAELAATQPGMAAIGSSLACEIYGLDVIAENIADLPGNETRFMILAREYGEATGDDKTSIVFSVRHKAGSLYDALKSFRQYDLNLTKIESRPSKAKAWEYYFFVDLEGHASDERVKAALDDLAEHCIFLKVLGSYPKAS